MPNMDDEATKERRRLGRLLDSTITPEQRRLFAMGRQSEIVWTPEQLEIHKKLQAYLEGLTFEKQQELGMMDVYQDGYTSGQKAGTLVAVVIVAFVVLFMVSHC
jgi:hypothetical protein